MVLAGRGCVVLGEGVWSGGVYSLGVRHYPPYEHANTCKIITFRQLRLLAVKTVEFQVILMRIAELVMSSTYAELALLAFKAFKKINIPVKRLTKEELDPTST